MLNNLQLTEQYYNWLKTIKVKIADAQRKAVTTANAVLIEFYWDLGESISQKVNDAKWGNKVIEQLANDLKKELPKLKGFSRTNLYYIKQFYETFSSTEFQNQFVPQLDGQTQNTIVPQLEGQLLPIKIPQLGGQIPWGHIKLILSKIKSAEQAKFYLTQTAQNGWSRETLALNIKTELHKRHGKAITNFKNTLQNPHANLAQQTIKDPYVFDFIELTESLQEKDIENQLINHVSKFLLELGKGFAFIGKQYHLNVAEQDYYIDLLFYHVNLKCYVVLELKNTRFKPEYAGKLNFYVSAIDEQLKTETDNPSIGIILCRDKNNVEVEFALRGMSQPLGVSEFTLTETLPEELKSALPTIEEIERELENK